MENDLTIFLCRSGTWMGTWMEERLEQGHVGRLVLLLLSASGDRDPSRSPGERLLWAEPGLLLSSPWQHGASSG